MIVDARGMRCPWPVVRLARALREYGDAVSIVADDPQAEAEIIAFAKETGRAVTRENTAIGAGWHVANVTDCLPGSL